MKTILTYSALAMFRDCRRKYFWRYVAELVTKDKPEALAFGTLIHKALALWHSTRNLGLVLALIDVETASRESDRRQRKFWHVARAMMKGYALRYPSETFTVVSTEEPFEGPLVNPETLHASTSHIIAGKVDAVVDEHVDRMLMEHKSVANWDADYLERLWCDSQIHIYAKYISAKLTRRVEGVIYNILKKPMLKQAEGETETEFIERRAALIAKSKTGKSSAQQQIPESDECYAARLDVKVQEPESFHREFIMIYEARIEAIEAELWDLSKNLLACRSSGKWYTNTSMCFARGRCPYFDLCKTNGSELIKDTLYERRPPHEELRDEVDLLES